MMLFLGENHRILMQRGSADSVIGQKAWYINAKGLDDAIIG